MIQKLERKEKKGRRIWRKGGVREGKRRRGKLTISLRSIRRILEV